MFKTTQIKFNNGKGSAWFWIPVIDVSEKDRPSYLPKIYECHPRAQAEWESFRKFSGELTTKDWVIDDIVISDSSMEMISPDDYTTICNYIVEAICKVDSDNINNIAAVCSAYQEVLKNKDITHNSELLVRICRTADTFIKKANVESPNKIVLCLNDAKLWCVDGLRGTSSILYGIDKREEFVDDYDVNIKYEYTDKGRLNRHDITPDTPTNLTEIDDPIKYNKPVFAAHQSDTHNGIFVMYDRRLTETDTYVTKVMYYDTDIYADPVNILGKVYYDCDEDYDNAEKDMYEYCSKIDCKFYDLKDLNSYISTIVADEEDFDRKLNLIEYGHRIIRDVNGYNAVYDTIDTEDQI